MCCSWLIAHLYLGVCSKQIGLSQRYAELARKSDRDSQDLFVRLGPEASIGSQRDR